MKAYFIAETGEQENYGQYMLLTSGNSHGDQVIEVEREFLNGSKKIVYSDYNAEGTWQSVSSLVEMFKEWIKEGRL